MSNMNKESKKMSFLLTASTRELLAFKRYILPFGKSPSLTLWSQK